MWAKQSDIELIEKFLTTSVNVLLTFEHLTLLLKVEELVVMTFKQAFWAYWIFFTVIAGMLVLFLVFLCSNSYLLCVMLATRRCPEKQVRYYFAIISILTLVFGACLYIFSALLLNLYQFFDSNRKAAYRPVFHALALGWLLALGALLRALRGPLT